MTELQEKVAALKIELSHLRSSFGARPFIPAMAKEDPLIGTTDARGEGYGADSNVGPRNGILPLQLGPMGSLVSHGGPPFDFRVAGQSEFQFSSKGGDQWQGKTGRYLMSMVPAVHTLLEWAERQNEPIGQSLLRASRRRRPHHVGSRRCSDRPRVNPQQRHLGFLIQLPDW